MVARLRKKERGVALLAVLLGLALMTLVIVDFAMTAGLGFVSAANQANELRSYYLARSGVNVGLGILAQDARAKMQAQTAYESLTDEWAMPFPTMPLEGGSVAVLIVDEARKISINSMIGSNGILNQAAVQRLERLFTVLDVNTELIPAILHWITPNGQNVSMGDSQYYLGLTPPYQPRGGPMPTIADLLMVKGFNEATFNRVRPFLTVMREAAVNVNTASPQVLAALEPELMEDQKTVQQIVEARAIRPFSLTTDVANEVPGVAAFSSRLLADIGVRSQFFTISGMGNYAGARKIINATFQRQPNGVGMLTGWHED